MQHKLRWVSAVGDDSSTGGGVARAVDLMRNAGLVPKNLCDNASLKDLSKSRQIRLALGDLFLLKYRHFVLHSVFSPYSWLVLSIPLGQRVLLLPHGELKGGALRLNGNKKMMLLALLKTLSFLFRKFRRIYVVASNDEELEKAKLILAPYSVKRISDIVTEACFFNLKHCHTEARGLSIVNIARMVPNKGIGDFLDEIMKSLQKRINSNFLHQLHAVHIFYASEDLIEERRVILLKQQIEDKSKLSVFLYADLNSEQIKEKLLSIPNKIPFLSSHFESFSYALIEMLSAEYQPITWFNNELTAYLESNNACIPIGYGGLPDEPHQIVATNRELVTRIKTDMTRHSAQEYKKIFKETFSDF